MANELMQARMPIHATKSIFPKNSCGNKKGADNKSAPSSFLR
jgi:hypothetical protein